MTVSRMWNFDTLLMMHIPKTAGTTLRWIIEQLYPQDTFAAVYPGHAPDLLALEERASRTRLRAVMGHVRFGVHHLIPGRTSYVTFFRNPVDQVLSHYNYIRASRDPLHREVQASCESLDQFLTHGWARNLQTQYLIGWTCEQVEANPRAALERAEEVLAEHFVGIGIVERFDTSLIHLAKRLGWRIPHYPKLNLGATNRPGHLVRGQLSAAQLANLAHANVCDLELYRRVDALVPQDGMMIHIRNRFEHVKRRLMRFRHMASR